MTRRLSTLCRRTGEGLRSRRRKGYADTCAKGGQKGKAESIQVVEESGYSQRHLDTVAIVGQTTNESNTAEGGRAIHLDSGLIT